MRRWKESENADRPRKVQTKRTKSKWNEKNTIKLNANTRICRFDEGKSADNTWFENTCANNEYNAIHGTNKTPKKANIG